VPKVRIHTAGVVCLYLQRELILEVGKAEPLSGRFGFLFSRSVN